MAAATLAACAPAPDPAERAGAAADLPVADLILNLGVNPQVGVVGEPLFYGARLDNGGPDDAPGAVIAVELPEGLAFQEATGPAASCEATAEGVECAIGTVQAGRDLFFEFATLPGAPGTYRTRARLFSLESSDPSPGNNSAELSTQVVADAADAYADLSLRIEGQAGGGRSGRPFPITYRVANAGPGLARDVLLYTTLIGPLDLSELGLPASLCAVNQGEVFCQLGDVAAGAEATLTLTTSPNDAGTLNVQGTAQTDLAVDTEPGDNSFSAQFEIQSGEPAAGVDLALALAASPELLQLEGSFTVTVGLSNFGLTPATGALATLRFPETVAPVEGDEGGICATQGGQVSCAFGAVPAGASLEEDVGFVSTGIGVASLDAQVQATEEDAWPPDNVAEVAVEVLPPGDVTFTDLEIQASSEPAVGGVGDPLILYHDVLNLGPADATGVVIYSYLPPGIAVDSARVRGEDCVQEENVIVCTAGSLPAGETVQSTVIVIPDEAGVFAENLQVTLDQLDAVASNNGRLFEVDISADAPSRVSDIAVALTPSTEAAVVGDEISWAMEVVNRGPDVAASVRLSAALPGAVTLTGVDIDLGRCDDAGGFVGCPIGVLASGGRVHASIAAQPTAPGTLTLTASASSLEADGDEANNQAASSITVAPRPGPALTAALGAGALPEEAAPGETNIPMLPLTLTAKGAQEVMLSRLTVAASGSGSDNHDVARVAVYADADGDGLPDPGAEPLASGTFGQDDGALVLPLAEPVAIAPGASLDLVLTYDLEAEIARVGAPAPAGRRPTMWPWALALAALGVALASPVARSRRRPWRWALAGLILAAPLSCGGRDPFGGATPAPRTYALTLTDVTAAGAAFDEAAAVEGLPIEGATVLLVR